MSPTTPTRSEPARTRSNGPGDERSSATGVSGSEPKSPTSLISGEPSKPSTGRYRLPRSVHEFAGQANLIATQVLNGDIDLETARAYSAIARTVAQAVTAETTRARILRSTPDLDFPNMDEEDRE